MFIGVHYLPDLVLGAVDPAENVYRLLQIVYVEVIGTLRESDSDHSFLLKK